MSDSLGTIYVNLTAETGGFVSALSKAAATAQSAAKSISSEFQSLGRVASQTFGAFGDFNPAISKFSFALEEAGRVASSTMKSLSGLPSVLGPLAGLSAGAAVGLGGLAAAAIGIAASSAESAARLQELSRATGVSVQSLSAMQFAARQTGVDQEQLVKSLQLLSTNMLKAAEAPKGAATAFSRMGLEIRQQNGDLKDSATFMGEVITKLSEMRDKTAAVGFARQTMGRGGAAMLQLGDPAEIQHWIETAQRLGIVLDSQTTAAAERFEQTLGVLRASAEGAANRLMAELLPALETVATAIENDLGKGPDLSWIARMAKEFISTCADLILIAEVTNAAVNSIGGSFSAPVTKFQDDLKKAAEGSKLTAPFKAVNAAVNLVGSEMLGDNTGYGKGGFSEYYAKVLKEHDDFVRQLSAPYKPGPEPPPRAGAANIGSATAGTGGRERVDEIAVLVSKLQAQASAELAAAAATEKGAAAALLSKAAIAAETAITETRTRLLEQEKSLRAELGSAQRESASGTSTGAGASRAAGIETQIAGIEKMLAELEAAAPRIKQLYAEIASGEFAVKASKDLADLAEKTDAETAAANRMASAYGKGGQAIVDASAGLKLAPFEKTRADLGDLIAGLEKLGVEASTIAPLRQAFDQLGDGIARAATAEKALALAKLTEEIGSQTNALRGEAEAYRITGEAALASAAAQREAAARAETVKFAAAHPEAAGGLTPAQVGAAAPSALPPVLGEVYSNAIEKENQQYDATVRQEAAQLDLNKAYQDELAKLEDIKAVVAAAGESTIAIDTRIYDLKISHSEDLQKQTFDAQNEELIGQAKLYDASVQLTEQWDKMAMTVGTIGEKFRAMADEVEIEGDNLGQHIAETMGKSVDDISGQFAKLIVTGKSSFRQMFDGIAQEILKAQIQWSFSKILEGAVGKPGDSSGASGGIGPGGTAPTFPGKSGIGGALAGAFGIKLPGAGAAQGPLGTKGNPMYVILTSAAAAAGSATATRPATPSIFSPSSSGSGDGAEDSLPLAPPGIGGIPNLIPLPPPASGLAGTGGSSSSGLLGMIASIFGKFTGGASGSAGSNGAPGAAAGGSALSSAATALSSAATALSSAATALSSAATALQSSSSGSSGSGGIFGFLSSDSSDSGSSDSGLGALAGLADIAAMATGGSVSRGQPYVVGEQRPEIFVPTENGRIVPSVSEFLRTAAAKKFPIFDRREYGGSVGAGAHFLTGENRPEVYVPNSYAPGAGSSSGRGAGVTHNEFHFHGVQDADSFRRSQGQIQADMQQQMSMAHYRNRGGY